MPPSMSPRRELCENYVSFPTLYNDFAADPSDHVDISRSVFVLYDNHVSETFAVADMSVLRIAETEGRVLVSHDRRTMPIHFSRFITTTATSLVQTR